MSLSIRKKGTKNFFHYWETFEYSASDLTIITSGETVFLRAEDGRIVGLKDGWNITDVSVYDDTASGTEETFANVIALTNRLIALGYPAYYITGDAPTEFTELTDTPDSYTGEGGKVVAVKGAEDGLEFIPVSGTGTVTSVAVSGSDGIEVDSGSPITTSGTIALGVNAANLKTHLAYLEEEIPGTATYDGAVTGATNIDLDNDACSRLILTGNATITFTNTPESGESVVRSYLIKSTTTQTLGFANSDNEYGTYAADGSENKVIVEASNYPTAGLIIDVTIQQPN